MNLKETSLAPTLGREVDFIKVNPTGNMTLLVTSLHHPEDYPSIATCMISAEHVHAEQVGFIHPPPSPEVDVHIQMAGNEFCGNGCMAAAAVVALEQRIAPRQTRDIRVSSSGTRDLLSCLVARNNHAINCTLSSPIPDSIKFTNCILGFYAKLIYVRSGDSLHVIIECSSKDSDLRIQAELLSRSIAAREKVSIITVLLYDPQQDFLTPLVHVPAVGSTVWEQSCCSGLTALAAYLATENRRSIQKKIRQPGGLMDIDAAYENERLVEIKVSSDIRIIAEGRAYVDA